MTTKLMYLNLNSHHFSSSIFELEFVNLAEGGCRDWIGRLS